MGELCDKVSLTISKSFEKLNSTLNTKYRLGLLGKEMKGVMDKVEFELDKLISAPQNKTENSK